jgi:hypothetical protein
LTNLELAVRVKHALADVCVQLRGEKKAANPDHDTGEWHAERKAG